MAERRTIGVDQGSYSGVRQLNQAASQEGQQGYNALAQGQQLFANLSQRSTEAFLGASTQIANSALGVAQAQANAAAQIPPLSQFADSIGKSLGLIEERQQKQLAFDLKQQEEHQKNLAALDNVGATAEIEQLATNAPTILYNNPGGEATYTDQVVKTLAKYENLSPDDRVTLLKTAFGSLGEAKKGQFNRVLADVTETKNVTVEATKANLNAILAGNLSQLKYATSQQDAHDIFLNTVGLLNDYVANSGLDGISQLKVVAAGLQTIYPVLQGNQDVLAEAVQFGKGIEELHTYAASIQGMYAQAPTSYAAAINKKAKELNIPFTISDKITDPNARVNAQLERINQQRTISEAQNLGLQNVIDNVQLPADFDRYEALAHYNDVKWREMASRGSLKNQYTTAIRLADMLKDWQTEAPKARQQIIQLNQSKAALTESHRKWQLGQIGTQQLTNQLNLFQQSGSLPPAAVQRMTDLLAGLGVGGTASANPEEVKRIHQDISDLFQLQLNGLDQQIGIAEQNLATKQKDLQDNGLLDSAGRPFDPKLYKAKHDAGLNQLKQAIQAADAANKAMLGGAQQPNFNQPVRAITQPQKIKSHTGASIPIPFGIADKGKVSLGDAFRSRGGEHQGLDLPAPQGTPFISLVNGTVVYAGDANDNYGNRIDIKDAATGQIHRYAHSSKLLVKKGDRVGAGMEIGLVGSTGRSTGAHLHYEVLDVNGQRVDPEVALGSLRFATKRPSGDNTEWVNGNQKIPGNALALNNGAYIYNNELVTRQVKKNLAEIASIAAALKIKLITPMPKETVADIPLNNLDTRGNFKALDGAYAALAAKPVAVKQKLAQVAQNVGIPVMWLADLIGGIENASWDHRTQNQYGCTGHIQFCPAVEGGDTKTIGGKTYTMTQLKNMSEVQQIGLIQDYLRDVGAVGKMSSFADLWAAVRWGKPKFESWMLTRGDGNQSNWSKDMARLKSIAGRTYPIPKEYRVSRANAVIHTSDVANCPICNQLANSNSIFIPHEGQSA